MQASLNDESKDLQSSKKKHKKDKKKKDKKKDGKILNGKDQLNIESKWFQIQSTPMNSKEKSSHC